MATPGTISRTVVWRNTSVLVPQSNSINDQNLTQIKNTAIATIISSVSKKQTPFLKTIFTGINKIAKSNKLA